MNINLTVSDMPGTCSMVEVHGVSPKRGAVWTGCFVEQVRDRVKSESKKVAIYNSNVKLLTWFHPGIKLVAKYKGNNYRWNNFWCDHFNLPVYVYLIKL